MLDRRIRSARASWFIATALVLGLLCYYVFVKGERRSAFARWRPQLQAFAGGEDIYRNGKYLFPTPPISALILTPFAQLPDRVGMGAWFLLKAVLTVAALRLLAAPPRTVAVAITAVVVAGPEIVGDLLHGNINLFVLFLVAAFFAAWSAGRSLVAGALLGLAVAVKVTPGLLLVWLAARRSFAALMWAVVGVAVWTFVVPAAFIGWDRNVALLTHWAEEMVAPFARDGVVEADLRNQSFPGALARWFTAADTTPFDDSGKNVQIHVADLSRSQFHWLLRGVSLVTVCVWLFARRSFGDDAAGRLADFSLCLLVALALSERSWKHHYVTILPACLTIAWGWRYAAGPTIRRRSATCLGIALAIALAAGKDVVGTASSDLLQAGGIYLAILMALGWGLLAFRRSAADA